MLIVQILGGTIAASLHIKQRLFLFMNLMLLLMSSCRCCSMQVLQPKMELLQFCDSVSDSNVRTTSSRQSDSAQQAQQEPGRPSSTARITGSQITLKDSEAPVHHCVEGSPSSTMHTLQSCQQQDDWRFRPEHRFPVSFWQEAHGFLVSVATDRNSSGTTK